LASELASEPQIGLGRPDAEDHIRLVGGDLGDQGSHGVQARWVGRFEDNFALLSSRVRFRPGRDGRGKSAARPVQQGDTPGRPPSGPRDLQDADENIDWPATAN